MHNAIVPVNTFQSHSISVIIQALSPLSMALLELPVSLVWQGKTSTGLMRVINHLNIIVKEDNRQSTGRRIPFEYQLKSHNDDIIQKPWCLFNLTGKKDTCCSDCL
ncbi:hypothetical protein SDJN02_07740, partial [Cucurbita argyrosperma subsp. argyrosperma]